MCGALDPCARSKWANDLRPRGRTADGCLLLSRGRRRYVRSAGYDPAVSLSSQNSKFPTASYWYSKPTSSQMRSNRYRLVAGELIELLALQAPSSRTTSATIFMPYVTKYHKVAPRRAHFLDPRVYILCTSIHSGGFHCIEGASTDLRKPKGNANKSNHGSSSQGPQQKPTPSELEGIKTRLPTPSSHGPSCPYSCYSGGTASTELERSPLSSCAARACFVGDIET